MSRLRREHITWPLYNFVKNIWKNWIPDVLLFPCHNQLWPYNELEKTPFEDEIFDEDQDLIEFLLLNNGFQPILPLVDDNFELRFLGLEIAPNFMNVFIVWKKGQWLSNAQIKTRVQKYFYQRESEKSLLIFLMYPLHCACHSSHRYDQKNSRLK